MPFLICQFVNMWVQKYQMITSCAFDSNSYLLFIFGSDLKKHILHKTVCQVELPLITTDKIRPFPIGLFVYASICLSVFCLSVCLNFICLFSFLGCYFDFSVSFFKYYTQFDHRQLFLYILVHDSGVIRTSFCGLISIK